MTTQNRQKSNAKKRNALRSPFAFTPQNSPVHCHTYLEIFGQVTLPMLGSSLADRRDAD